MKPLEILNKHNLKGTGCRLGIIELMLHSVHPLSENEIRTALNGNYDRTTFYRSFKTLEEHRIVHKVVVDNQIVKYELDSTITKRKRHAHFYCNSCKTVQCLDGVEVPNPVLPEGYRVSEIELIVKGECSRCGGDR